MANLDGCQIPGYARVAEGEDEAGPKSPGKRLKSMLARPWNYQVKPLLKRTVKQALRWRSKLSSNNKPGSPTSTDIASAVIHLQAGDRVRVRSREEIQATLDPFKELKGCAFLEFMWQYCGTTQRVLQPVERFLDERDYKVKKTRGVVLLEGVLCRGTPVFGRCDRACHLLWREEWLEKLCPDDQTDTAAFSDERNLASRDISIL
jgi:hypothetical protein